MCALAQLVLDLAKIQPAHVMVLFVVLGAVTSSLGLYGPLVQRAGAGASIPLAGFGHTLVQGIAEDVAQKGVVGLLTGGLRATALGLSAAILFAWLMSVLFNPRG
jgi:stage V sporulation protein AE